MSLELDELTPIGFGAYRADAGNAGHAAALTSALAGGCNLIDTAPNYEDGRSEELIGDVLEATGSDAFVVTKVGYVSPSALVALARAGVNTDRLPTLEGGTPFTLEPSALRALLELSRSRLRRPTLDAVLLHNPELLLTTGLTSDRLHAAIDSALSFLDDEVNAGRLRYYGISSNEMPSARSGTPMAFDTIQRIVTSSCDQSRFAFLEFPFNLLECAAATNGLFEMARAAGTRTLSNRPLNALVDGQPIRLALRAPASTVDDPWDECTSVVGSRLKSIGQTDPWWRFAPMQFLRDNRDGIPDPDLLDLIWRTRIEPFIEALFDGTPTKAATEAFSRLRSSAEDRARRAMEASTHRALGALESDGRFRRRDDESVAVSACRYCLDAGADHVLVGMRRAEYVAELKHLFRLEPSVIQVD